MKVSVSGIRGVFPTDLTLEHVMAYVKAFSHLSNRYNLTSCVLAYDARASSRVIARVASAVLRSQGMDVYNIGLAPTPVLVKESKERNCMGIMVTASHNPLDWNGIKFVINSRCIFDEELRDLLASVGIDDAHTSTIGNEYNAYSCYTRELLRFLDNEIVGRSSVKGIAIDASIGTVSAYMQELLSSIGFNASIVNSSNPDPTSRGFVVKDGIGFAFDSDGDRVVVSKGSILSPDDTLLLCIASVIRSSSSITVSVDTSNSIRDLAYAYNCKVNYAKVGEANVVKCMLNNNSMIGGEGSSAGFIMGNFNLCRDAILASLLILLAYDNIDFILKEYSRYAIKRGKVAIDADVDIGKVIEYIAGKEHRCSEKVTIDGVKFVIDDNTWVLVRGSNTEHVIRLSVESLSKDRVNTLYKMYEDIIVEACRYARREGDN